MSDPTRWLLDPERAPEAAVELLRAARPSPPLPASTHVSALRLAAELSATKVTTAGSAFVAAKLFAVVVAGVTGAAAAHALWGSTAHRVAADPGATHIATEARVHAVPPNRTDGQGLPAPTQILALESLLPEEPLRGSSAPVSARPHGKRPIAIASSSVADETALGERARAMLETDPSIALALTREYEQTFPNGQLRGALAIIGVEALERLQRRAEAREAAARRLEANAHDIYADRMRSALK